MKHARYTIMSQGKMRITPEMEAEAKVHQELSIEVQELVASRQKKVEQLNENMMVKTEMDMIQDDAVVYKKIGPTLVKQDLSMAKGWIGDRISFIEKGINAVNASIEEKQKAMQEVENRVQQMQVAEQQKMAKAAKEAEEEDQ